jgi:hypothetical protein
MKFEIIDGEGHVTEGALTDGQRAQLVEIAERCPVPRTFVSEINRRTRLAAAPLERRKDR